MIYGSIYTQDFRPKGPAIWDCQLSPTQNHPSPCSPRSPGPSGKSRSPWRSDTIPFGVGAQNFSAGLQPEYVFDPERFTKRRENDPAKKCMLATCYETQTSVCAS